MKSAYLLRGKWHPINGSLLVVGLLGLIALASATTVRHPKINFLFTKQNLWISLANKLNRTNFCVSLARPESPFHTCLIGIPLNETEYGYIDQYILTNLTRRPCQHNVSQCLIKHNEWDFKLPYGGPPDELEIFGSLHAASCLYINSSCQDETDRWCNTRPPTNVSPQEAAWKNDNFWCRSVALNKTHPAVGTVIPRRLPPGIFLICGDRAFSGIPQRPAGGPCTFGRLTIALPNQDTLAEINANITRVTVQRQRRAVIDASCNDEVKLFNCAEQIVASLFLPGLAAGHALFQLERLQCWVSKQANATSELLSLLATDLDTVRHVTLQNRAAIDFLLLAHGHGCED